jgi:hypothetical protein
MLNWRYFVKSVKYIALCVVGSGLLLAQTPQLGSIRTDFAYPQKDAPLQVVGVTLNLDGAADLCQKVTIVNTSEKTVTRVQVGWVISDVRNAADGRGTVAYGPVFKINLPPSEVMNVGPQGATLASADKAAKDLGISHATILVGVVYTEFADGSEWYYPLKERKSFVEHSDPTLLQKIGPKVREFQSGVK